MAKKTVALLLCITAIFCMLLPHAAALTARYIVCAPVANVLDKPNPLTGKKLFEIYEGTYIEAIEEDNDFLKVRLNSTGLVGWVVNDPTVITYVGSTPYNPNQMTGIRIFRAPNKTQYIQEEEEFDPTGLVVSGLYANAPEAVITGYTLFVPPFNSPGQKTVYVTYKPPGSSLITFSTSFTVTVARVPVSEMSIASLPQKPLDSYIEGQKLDLTGLSVRLGYFDGRADGYFSAEEILSNTSFTITGCHSENHGKQLSAGKHTLHIYYKYTEISCSLELTARKKVLTAFEVSSPPDSLTVYEKKMPDLTGLVLKATYDNGLSEEIPLSMCNIICNPDGFILGNGNKLTIEFGGKTVELSFTLALEEKTGIELRGLQNLTFVLGEPIDLSALEVYYVYSSGKTEKAKSFTRSKIDPMRTEPQTVAVTCDGFVATFPVIIVPAFRLGDVTGDGLITSMDARLTLRNAVGLTHFAGKVLAAADANRDGKITAMDARLILRAAVGLEDFLKDIRGTLV